jgi:hypothetical protein
VNKTYKRSTASTLMVPGIQVSILINDKQDKKCKYKLVLWQERKIKQTKISLPRNDCSITSHGTPTTYLFAYIVLPKWNVISSLYPKEIRCEKDVNTVSVCTESTKTNIEQARSVHIFRNHQTQVLIIRTTRNGIRNGYDFRKIVLMLICIKCNCPELYSGILSFKLGCTLLHSFLCGSFYCSSLLSTVVRVTYCQPF